MGITIDIEFDYFISIELEKLTSFALGSFRVFFVFVFFFFHFGLIKKKGFVNTQNIGINYRQTPYLNATHLT